MDGDPYWVICRENWCQTFYDACIRLDRVMDRLETGMPMTAEYDGKIIDICLSIIDDYEKAKTLNFQNPDWKPNECDSEIL